MTCSRNAGTESSLPFEGTTSKTLPWRRNWAADPERNRSRISEAQRGSSLAHWLSRARVSVRQRRRLGEQILHRAVDLLLIANPLTGAAERRGDVVDAPRQQLGIGRHRRLLANQFDLLLDALELGFDVGELAVAIGALLQALAQDLELAAQAARQFLAQPGLHLLPLQRGDAALQLDVVLRAAHHLADGPARQQEAQEHPRQTAEALGLLLEAVGRLCRVVHLHVDDRAAAFRERVVLTAIGGIEPAEHALDAVAPFLARRVERLHRHRLLESLVGGQAEEVAQLEAGADDPEAGIGRAEDAEGGNPHPVGRHEHAQRPRVEGGGEIVEESRLGGHREQSLLLARIARGFRGHASRTSTSGSERRSAFFVVGGAPPPPTRGAPPPRLPALASLAPVASSNECLDQHLIERDQNASPSG